MKGAPDSARSIRRLGGIHSRGCRSESRPAPEVFQRCLAQHLEGLEGVVNIMDDILVWGDDTDQHDRRLRQLPVRLRSLNLKLNKDKSKIRMKRISLQWTCVYQRRPETRLPEGPRNTSQRTMHVRGSMGMLQYLSDVSAPLTQLLERDIQWHWESAQEQSFRSLKTLVSNKPVLKYYDVKKKNTDSLCGCKLRRLGSCDPARWSANHT